MIEAPSEQRYEIANITADDTVASRIVFGYDPSIMLRRYTILDSDVRTENSNEFFMNMIGGVQTASHYIEVMGRLFPNGSALPDDPVLFIDIWLEIPKGTGYQAPTGPVEAVPQDLELLYTTLTIRKRDLFPPTFPFDFNNYQRALFPVNMEINTAGLGGPFHTKNSAHRFDIHVRFAGTEDVALRAPPPMSVSAVAFQHCIRPLPYPRQSDIR